MHLFNLEDKLQPIDVAMNVLLVIAAIAATAAVWWPM
jgi:hypothetical protein